MGCVQKDMRYATAAERAKPAYKAEGCAWQTRRGADGRMYRSQPNDKGQFVWTLVPKTRLQRARSAARGAWRDYAPTAAGYVGRRAAILLHKKINPDLNFWNHEMAWDAAAPRGRSMYVPGSGL